MIAVCVMMSVQIFILAQLLRRRERTCQSTNDYSKMHNFVMNNPQHCFGLKLALNLSKLRLYFAYPKLSGC